MAAASAICCHHATNYRPVLVLSEGVTKLTRSANLPDAEKTVAVREYEEHLHRATTERAHYTDVCKSVKESMPPGLSLGRHAACSYAGICHYSVDFAQQVHFPSNPLQPGPIYFKCPRKCGLFSVACEAFPKQVNFLLDESINTVVPTVWCRCCISSLRSMAWVNMTWISTLTTAAAKTKILA